MGNKSKQMTFSSQHPTDEELVQAVVSHDRAAFSLLYDRYAQTVYALAAHLVGAAEAEELTQEVFLTLWRSAEQFDAERGSFKSWFLTVARNRTLDALKQRTMVQRKQTALAVDQLFASTLDPAEDALHNVWLKEHRDILSKALEGLPAEQRKVIVMAYFGGCSQTDIAELLDLPLGTVKKRIRLGMQKLRIALAHRYEVK